MPKNRLLIKCNLSCVLHGYQDRLQNNSALIYVLSRVVTPLLVLRRYKVHIFLKEGEIHTYKVFHEVFQKFRSCDTAKFTKSFVAFILYLIFFHLNLKNFEELHSNILILLFYTYCHKGLVVFFQFLNLKFFKGLNQI